jgi:hypothetical protein
MTAAALKSLPPMDFDPLTEPVKYKRWESIALQRLKTDLELLGNQNDRVYAAAGGDPALTIANLVHNLPAGGNVNADITTRMTQKAGQWYCFCIKWTL